MDCEDNVDNPDTPDDDEAVDDADDCRGVNGDKERGLDNIEDCDNNAEVTSGECDGLSELCPVSN